MSDVSRPPPLLIESPRDGVMLLTIDRAEQFNTLSIETLEAIDIALRAVARGSEETTVIVSGAGGRAFAAGANIREFALLTPREALAFAQRGQRVFDLLERMPQTVIAAIEGYCLGGGLDLALACDVRIASPHSVFAHPGAGLGIMTGFGGTQRLSRLVGPSRAVELFATARHLDASEALEIGLVDAIHERPVEAAVEIAAAIGRSHADRAALKAIAIRSWRRRTHR